MDKIKVELIVETPNSTLKFNINSKGTLEAIKKQLADIIEYKVSTKSLKLQQSNSENLFVVPAEVLRNSVFIFKEIK